MDQHSYLGWKHHKIRVWALCSSTHSRPGTEQVSTLAEGLSERTESSSASALERSTVPSGDWADDGESLEVMQKSSGYWETQGTTED